MPVKTWVITQVHTKPPCQRKVIPRRKETKRKEEEIENLKTQQSKINSIFNRWFSIMQRHTFSPLIFDSPTTVVDGFVFIGLAYAALTFSRAVCIRVTPIGMHRIKEVRNIMRGSDIDMSQSSIAVEVLEM